MALHRAYGQDIESLDIVVVDDAKPMQTILRSILHSAHVARVRAFDTAEAALQAMVIEPPHLLITDWYMRPVDGLTLLRTIRRRRMGAVALVPSILVTAHPTRALVEATLETGAHFVIAKPLSPATLLKRISYILTDPREFAPGDDDQDLALEGQSGRIARERDRWLKAIGETRPLPPLPAGRPLPPDRPALAGLKPALPAAGGPRGPGFAAVQRTRLPDAGHGPGGGA